ncbi:MAG TPA: leucine--tRNA ligase [Pyrinomonadaceae bacterium]|nr:leucine--tRNA ligase [Pyrinomonadaceae bacterium]
MTGSAVEAATSHTRKNPNEWAGSTPHYGEALRVRPNSCLSVWRPEGLKTMDEKYFPEKIEDKWQKRWEETGAFEVERDPQRPKFYCLEMLPYPSGFLHMGHVRNYSIGDALSWYKRLRGFNVLHPIGWDSFGQPAEQAAIKRGIQPRDWTEENIAHMRGQLKRLGISYDWRREIAAHRPEYYKWDQWFFLKMYERGLAYRRLSQVNWCPKEETVLSNEQSSGGVCWRCQTPVVKKDLEQWFIRITEYAEQLLDDMKEIEAGWPERVLTMQRNWIGRSVGAYIDFTIQETDVKVRVFTTRIDTVYGATAIVLAAEHPVLDELLESSPLRGDVRRFVKRVQGERNRASVPGEEVEKEGINTGLIAINPFNGERLPVWVANYVLMDYGTGAVMSVPAHDERDYEFAQKYSLPIKLVIAPITHDQEPSGYTPEMGVDQSKEMRHAFTDYGVLVNSGEWGGKLSEDAIREMARFAEESGFGGGAVTYRLRDWGISRQRFWGAPIPIIYCEECGVVPVPEKDLPVVLPERAEFTGTGESPLAGIAEFVNTTCPKCSRAARRETDTMDTFVDSSWYFFRYCDPHETDAPFDKEKVAYWTPVDQYIGGISHAVMHLLYTRFWTKMMRDIGLVSFDEPVKSLLTQGMVTNLVEVTNEWKAMSKSLGNGVDPDEMIAAYGADAVRLFILFAAPVENELRWSESGIDGAVRFLRRVYGMIWRWQERLSDPLHSGSEPNGVEFSAAARALRRKTHQTIARVTEDFEQLHFNTSVAALMELSNALGDFNVRPSNASASDAYAVREALESLVVMLAPFSPHVAEEMWEGLGRQGGLLSGEARWPQANEELARKEELEIPVQVNGKLRSRIRATPDTPEEVLREAALSDEKVRGFTHGHEVVKVIIVPQRLVNIVVR